MTTEDRLGELVLSWQTRRAQGQTPSPEDLCGDCPELAPALRARLEALQAMAGFLASTPQPMKAGLESTGAGSTFKPDPDLPTKTAPSHAPSVNRYDVVRFHAKGGLGEVYLALDAELGREVALKRIQPRHADHPESRQRFQREAEITAKLSHPGIVPVYGLVHDADGRPCYAMRFIEGESMADAIDRLHGFQANRLPVGENASNRQAVGLDYNGLPFRQLLQKYVTVCNTLAYAHSKGVIHRDVKPHNVMLGQFGETLVVDWGLAKTVASDQLPVASDDVQHDAASLTGNQQLVTGNSTPVTEAGRAMGTLAYMSPEQAAGQWDQVGPQSDVYSLGATLYHLLVGKSPMSGLQVAKAVLAIHEGRFPRPHEVKNVPRGLAAITFKAMASRPADRYANALDLARDVERWLADDPVACHAEPMLVRTGRWARKHRTLVTSAVAVLLVTAIGSIAGLAIVGGFNQRLDAANNELTGKNTALETSIANEKAEKKRAENTLEFFVAALRRPDPSQDGKKLTVYELLAQAVKGMAADFTLDPMSRSALLNAIGLTYQGLGEYPEAIAAHDFAGRLAEEEMGNEYPATLTYRNNLAVAYQAAGNLEMAIPLFERTLKPREAKLGDDHPGTLTSRNNLAVAYQAAGRQDLAIPLLERTLKAREGTLGNDHLDTHSSRNSLGDAYRDAGKLELAIPLLERTLKAREAKLGDDHPDTHSSRNSLAGAYYTAGKLELAIPLLERSVKALEAKQGDDHPQTLNSRNNLATAYVAAGKLDLAIPLHERTLRAFEAKLGDDHSQTFTARNNLAGAYQAAGKLELATSLFERTLKALEAKQGDEHPDTLITRNNLASAYKTSGKLDLAIPLHERTLRTQEAKLGDDHPDTLASRNNLALAYKVAGKLDLAIPLHERTLKACEAKLGDDHPNTVTSRNNLALAYKVAGKLDLAIPLYERALKAHKAKLGDDHPNTLTSRGNLANAYLEAQRCSEALPLFETFFDGQRKRLPAKLPQFAAMLANASVALLKAKQFVAAEQYLRECLALREKIESDAWTTFDTKSMLGAAIHGQGKYADAEPLLLAGFEGMQEREAKIPAEAKILLTGALQRLVHLYDAWTKPDEAARWRAKLPPEARIKGGLERDHAWPLLWGWGRW